MAKRIKAGFEEVFAQANDKLARLEAEAQVRTDERTAELKAQIAEVEADENSKIACDKEALEKILDACQEEYEEVVEETVSEEQPVENVVEE